MFRDQRPAVPGQGARSGGAVPSEQHRGEAAGDAQTPGAPAAGEAAAH